MDRDRLEPPRQDARPADVNNMPGRGSHAQRIRRLGRATALLLVGLVVVLVMYRPTLTTLTETLPRDLGDPTLNTWILSWESHALFSDPANFFDGNAFYPYGEAIKYSEMMLPVLLPFAAVYLVSGDPVLAHNLVLLGLAVFCFITTYLLGRRLAGRWTALVAAASFSFSAYVFMHQSHLQLMTLGFFPLAFLVLFKALERRRVSDGIWLGVCTALLTTAAVYYGAIWFVCLAAVVLVDLLRLRKPDGAWWRMLMSAAVTTVVLVGPFAYVYASFHARTPYYRDVGGLGLNPIDFLTPAPESVVYAGLSNWANARQPADLVEHGFFMGFVVMALAAVGLILLVRSFRGSEHSTSPRSRYEMGLLTVAGAVSLLMAIGPEVLGIPMPFAVFRAWVPGYDKMRAVSRLAIPALLAAAVLAAWGLEFLLRRLDPMKKLIVAAVVAAAILLELMVSPARVEVPQVSPIREVLAGAPQGAVLELPMLPNTDPQFAFVEGPRLLSSIGDWRPRFNAYSGGVPPRYSDDIEILSQFPSDRALEHIDELGIRYVLLHGAENQSADAFSLAQIDQILGSLPTGSSISRAENDWLVDLGT